MKKKSVVIVELILFPYMLSWSSLMWLFERTCVSCSRARSVHEGISGRSCMPEAMTVVFLAGKVQKKFAAINDSVNLHTSAIGGDKWPEVAMHGEWGLRARINNRVYRRWWKKSDRSFIASISWLYLEIDSGSFCVQKLYNIAMINVLDINLVKTSIGTSWFVFKMAQVINHFHDQQFCYGISLFIAWNSINTIVVVEENSLRFR